MIQDNKTGLQPHTAENCPLCEEVIELRKKVEILSTQVRTDFLTGLFNKQHFLFSLEQEIERTSRNQQPTSLLLVDADHFKSINDNHGHVVGDKVLQHLAATIQETVRKIDIPCRYGGEEFAIILPSTPNLVGVQVAERLRSRIEDSEISISSDLSINITASIGIDTYSKGEKISPNTLIERADAELYRAKNEGRNKVCYRIQKIVDPAEVSKDEKDALFGPG